MQWFCDKGPEWGHQTISADTTGPYTADTSDSKGN